jgi:hypothetical protein
MFMLKKIALLTAFLTLVTPLNGAAVAQTTALSSTFTYQGYLTGASGPLNGLCDFQFSLFDAIIGGIQDASTTTKSAVPVNNGSFTVPLDFGSIVMDGTDRYLQIAVRCPAGSGIYTTLTPRQAVTPAPYAQFAQKAPWSGLSGVPVDFTDGIDNDMLAELTCTSGQVPKWSGSAWNCAADVAGTSYTAGTGLSLTGSQFSLLTGYQLPQSCINGQITQWNGNAWVCVADNPGTDWTQTGNAGTTAGTNFIGTTDNQALEFKVNGVRALRIEPSIPSPNLIGGYSGNIVSEGVFGAVISGGGDSGYVNSITDYYGVIGGGRNNQAGNNSGLLSDAFYATVAGGWTNTASSVYATVGGGRNNIAQGDSAIVPGGYSNTAIGSFSFAAGRQAKALHNGTFVWGDSSAADVSSTGSDQFLVRASGGTVFYSSSDLSTGAVLNAGSGSWSSSSDRNVKSNFTSVDPQAILAQVATLQLSTWNYNAQDPSIRHIGPMAQDFYAAFKVGEDDKHISTIDSEGVALAAIQGLYQMVQKKDAKIAALETENQTLKNKLDDIDTRLSKLEAQAASGNPNAGGGLGLVLFAVGSGALAWWRKRGA